MSSITPSSITAPSSASILAALPQPRILDLGRSLAGQVIREMLQPRGDAGRLRS